MGSGSLSTGRKPWEYQNSSQGCVWVSVYKLKCVQKKKKKKHCVCARQRRFRLASTKSPTTSVPHGKNTTWKVRLGRAQQPGSSQTFFPRSYKCLFFYMFVNAPSVFRMLEYNWYGQVSETDAPAVIEVKGPKLTFRRLFHTTHPKFSSIKFHLWTLLLCHMFALKFLDLAVKLANS